MSRQTDEATLAAHIDTLNTWLATAHGCDFGEMVGVALLQVIDAAERAKDELPPWSDTGYRWIRLPTTGPEDVLKELRATLDTQTPGDRGRMVQWLQAEALAIDLGGA